MPNTTLDSIALALPELGELVADATDLEDPAILHERRWIGDDGLYVVMTLVETARGTEFAELALDEVVGATLYRYVDELHGELEAELMIDIAGALAGRAVRASLASEAGEPLGLLMVAGVASDKRIVLLQLTWPEPLTENYLPRAIEIGRSLSFLPETQPEAPGSKPEV